MVYPYLIFQTFPSYYKNLKKSHYFLLTSLNHQLFQCRLPLPKTNWSCGVTRVKNVTSSLRFSHPLPLLLHTVLNAVSFLLLLLRPLLKLVLMMTKTTRSLNFSIPWIQFRPLRSHLQCCVVLPQMIHLYYAPFAEKISWLENLLGNCHAIIYTIMIALFLGSQVITRALFVDLSSPLHLVEPTLV